MNVYLSVKFQVSSVILTTFRQGGVILPPPQNEPLKSPPRLGLREHVKQYFQWKPQLYEKEKVLFLTQLTRMSVVRNKTKCLKLRPCRRKCGSKFLGKLSVKALREKCRFSGFFCSTFCRIRTEYEEIFRFSPYSVWNAGNADQNNPGYGHFLRSEELVFRK